MSPQHEILPRGRQRSTLATGLLTLLAAAACARGSADQPGQPLAQPPVSVTLTRMAPQPVDRTADYIGQVRSRRSSEIRPQVDGLVTRIFVRPGQQVPEGAPLVQIDPLRQEATVASQEASRAAQEATLRLAREELERARGLFKEGLISRQQLDQAVAAADTAEAALSALKARERESRVQLQYHRVTAPTAGTVGDIPVRVGDRVETSTVLTTIDQRGGLELYVRVPVERAPDLRLGMPVRLLDQAGEVIARTAVDFISPQVDESTQTVLAKAPLPGSTAFRTEQFVRAQVVWTSEPALTIPALAVARVNGQYFAYVAEPEGSGLVARQRLVRLGPLTGDSYVVLDGLAPGDRIVTEGLQRLRDGAPISAGAAPAAAPAAPAAR